MKDPLIPPRPGDIRLRGPLGAAIDRTIAARMLSPLAREEIVPEAVAAFKHRVDDRIRPGQGLWQGEFWGKWTLSAIAAQRYTGSGELLELVRQSTDALIATRRADGYIGTYHDSGFVTGNTWNVWCRKYTLWGLIEAYNELGDARILEAAAGLMDHLATEVGPGRIDIVRTGNFYGLPSCSILTPVLELHRLTGAERYLAYARYIVEQWAKFPGEPPDILRRGLTGAPVHQWFPEAGPWTKAYEFLSCVEGLLHLYRISGEPDFLTAVRNIHHAIREHERVVTGGIGYHDKLLAAATRPDGLNEPCDVVYWQRLNFELLRLTGKPEYADEIERLAWNVLLTAVNPDGSWALRRTALAGPHLIAPCHCRLAHHQCCVANIPRGLLQLAETAVMRAHDETGEAIVVNLFLPGSFALSLASGRRVAFEVQTRYPEENRVRLRFTAAPPADCALRLRIPPWSASTRIRIDGKDRPAPPPEPGQYAELRGPWKDDAEIDVALDLRPRALALSGAGARRAILRGPLVLSRSGNAAPDPEIHAPAALPPGSADRLELTPVTPPGGVRLAFDLKTADGSRIRLCDYASTGGNYAKPPADMPGPQMAENHTDHDLRVWLPVKNSQ